MQKVIKNSWKSIQDEKEVDFFQKSFGAWKRTESAEESVRKARSAFNRSMNRHHHID